MIVLFLCEKDGAKTEALLQRAAVLYGNKKGITPADLTIARTETGKPFFNNEERIKFSVSHSGNIWACLMSDRDLGLDIQYMRDADFDKIAGRFFTEVEQEYVERNGREGFYDVWCRKEAIVKYFGEALPTGFGKYDTLKWEYEIDSTLPEVKIRVKRNLFDNCTLFEREMILADNLKSVCIMESPEEIEIIWM